MIIEKAHAGYQMSLYAGQGMNMSQCVGRSDTGIYSLLCVFFSTISLT